MLRTVYSLRQLTSRAPRCLEELQPIKREWSATPQPHQVEPPSLLQPRLHRTPCNSSNQSAPSSSLLWRIRSSRPPSRRPATPRSNAASRPGVNPPQAMCFLFAAEVYRSKRCTVPLLLGCMSYGLRRQAYECGFHRRRRRMFYDSLRTMRDVSWISLRLGTFWVTENFFNCRLRNGRQSLRDRHKPLHQTMHKKEIQQIIMPESRFERIHRGSAAGAG
ncbi:hypothetical protein FPV67DRAFT_642309 [Lyophyllum atratum]|nr:hypothetical protein FPV67DRAFT_642309 [Lyophyllum atratum]